MTDPPPRQLETSASIPEKLQMSKKPNSPLLGIPEVAADLGRLARERPRRPRLPALQHDRAFSAVLEAVRGDGAPEARPDDDRVDVLRRAHRWNHPRANSFVVALSRRASAALRLVHPVRERHVQRCGSGVERREMGLDRGLGHQVAVILEHGALAFGEHVEVDADRRDEIADEPSRVRRCRWRRIVVGRARDTPVRALELRRR